MKRAVAPSFSIAMDRRYVLAGAATLAAALALPRVARAAEPIEIVTDSVPADATEVIIDKMAYQTPEVKVKVGQTVKWTNKDGMAHNVFFRQGPAKGKPNAQGPMLNTGGVYAVKFNEAGEYTYICAPHPMMKAKVIVEA
jgi:amicyanin